MANGVPWGTPPKPATKHYIHVEGDALGLLVGLLLAVARVALIGAFLRHALFVPHPETCWTFLYLVHQPDHPLLPTRAQWGNSLLSLYMCVYEVGGGNPAYLQGVGGHD